MRFTFLSLLIACSSKTIPEAAQCGDMEKGIFLSCLDTDCSASYQQSLAGTDACAVDGKTNTISIEAAGSCGFSSSGSCFVICDCPDDAVIKVDVEELADGDAEDGLDECLTVDSPEWATLQADVAFLTAETTALISAVDTLNMQYGRLELDVEQVAVSVDTLETNANEVTAAIDELTTSVDSSILTTSTWDVSVVDYYPLTWPGGEIIADAYCIIGWGFDPFDPPLVVSLSYGTSSYDVFTVPYEETSADLRCNSELGNTACTTYTTNGISGRITDDGALVTEDWICSSTAYAYIHVTILDDKEYFAP